MLSFEEKWAKIGFHSSHGACNWYGCSADPKLPCGTGGEIRQHLDHAARDATHGGMEQEQERFTGRL